MANVGFKMGTQEALDALLKAGTGANASNGTFYLTSNTNRLYIGKADGSIAPVNAGIITVDRVSYDANYPDDIPLPAGSKEIIGNYYYATHENILCVYNGQNWVQINSVVTNTDMSTDVSAITGGAKVTSTVEQSAGIDVTDSYNIKGGNGIVVEATSADTLTITTDSPMTLAPAAGSNNKSAAVTLTSGLAKDGAQTFNIVAGDNVNSVVASDNNVTINVQDTKNDSLTHTLSGTNNNVTVTTTVTPTAGVDVSDDFNVVGSNGISVSASGTTMTVSADKVEVGVTSVTDGASVSLDSDLIESTKKDFNIVSGNSNVTVAVDGKNIKISSVDKDTKLDSMTVTAKPSNGFTITATPTEGENVEASFDPVIAVGSGDTKTQAHFNNGVATLDVYTIGQTDTLIENKLKLFNAMTYKGTIPSGGSLPSTNVAIGDTYLVSSDGFTHNGISYPAGTMAIARPVNDGVQEDANGFIPAGSIAWDFVTGSQIDTQYELNGITNGIQLTANGVSAAGTLKVNGDDKVITVSSASNPGSNQVLTVTHKDYAGTNTSSKADNMTALSSGYEIVAIDSLTLENGHISGYTTKTYTVLDTNASFSDYSLKTSNLESGNGVSVRQSITLTPSAGQDDTREASFSIKSENENLKVAVDGVSGQSQGIKINLEWGSF